MGLNLQILKIFAYTLCSCLQKEPFLADRFKSLQNGTSLFSKGNREFSVTVRLLHGFACRRRKMWRSRRQKTEGKPNYKNKEREGEEKKNWKQNKLKEKNLQTCNL